jgi:pyruvate formate lyase activating enzyme
MAQLPYHTLHNNHLYNDTTLFSFFGFNSMIKAGLFSTTDSSNNTVQCELCPHSCLIADGHTGLCHTRRNSDGILYAENYGKIVAASPDPVEKKPLYHFLPNHLSYSISSVGCNFRCLNCQNSSISQQKPQDVDTSTMSPEDVVQGCLDTLCQSISYTYTEPTTLFEFLIDTAQLAEGNGLKNIMVSNGYMSDGCIDQLLPHIHAINIDLKSFSNSFYHKVCHGTLGPVLNTIKRFFTAGVHIEITTLVIPGLSDSLDDLRGIARFIHNLSPKIPWHISRFHPSYKLTTVPLTPSQSLQDAYTVGVEAGLHHIYIGNAQEFQNHTRCHNCQSILFERSGFTTNQKHFANGCCTNCGTRLFGQYISS